MSELTGIEWTDHTFNIAWGCVKVSPGCQHCYADTLSRRYGHDVWGPAKTTPRRTFGPAHWADPVKWNRKAEAAGVRRRVFCSSMCDVFEDHPAIDEERAKLWPLIRATPWLDWQLLTKRPERISANLPDDWGSGYPNVWLGTSIESDEYRVRAAHLITIPAVVRFLSVEPLLARLDLHGDALRGRTTGRQLIHWVIVGGESGPGARPMETEWAREIRDVCQQYGAAFFLKQLGGARDKRGHDAAVLDGERWTQMPQATA